MSIKSFSFIKWLWIGLFLSLFSIMSCTIIEDEDSLSIFILTPSEVVLEVQGKTNISISNSSSSSSYYDSNMISWVSADNTIATVKNGEVTAINPGITTIKVSFRDTSKTATATIKVLPPVPKNFASLTKPLICNESPPLELSWDSSEGAVFYELYRNDDVIDTTAETSYIDSGLELSDTYTYYVKACLDGSACSGESTSITITNTGREKSFRTIINSGKVPEDLSGYDERSWDIFSLYKGGIPLVAKYVKEGGSGDGTSFTNATNNLKAVVDGITDASETNVYVVLLSGGTYTPETMAMKKYVAIVGGVEIDECLDSSDAATILDGERSRRVFTNSDLTDTAILYGVTIANGSAVNGGGMYNSNASPFLVRVIFSGNQATGNGGGMYNEDSSPFLVRVTFSDNSAVNGGGIYNFGSSPSLVGVTFSGNTANNNGGGMYNTVSFPYLHGATFSGNTANNNGGGMYNESSSPHLYGATFSGNTASKNGGGMYNEISSPRLYGITFSKNTANKHGGGMYNDNDGEAGPTIINGIFWGNSATTSGPEFYLANDSGGGKENLNIYNSIVKGIYTSSGSDSDQGGFVAPEGGEVEILLSSNIIATNPQLFELADNGGWVQTHAIPSDSSAVNEGLYIKLASNTNSHGTTTTHYYSKDNSTWYTQPDLSGKAKDPPDDAKELTLIDARGFIRVGKPDLGAYEYGGTRP